MSKNRNTSAAAIIVVLLIAAWGAARIWNPAPPRPGQQPADGQQAGRDQAQGNARGGNSSDQQTDVGLSARYLRTFSAQVEFVADGDTLTCKSDGEEIRVRFWGIDAPERDQSHGAEARAALRKLVDGQAIEVRVVDVDQYGRQVARVVLPGSDTSPELDVNRRMIADGWAWWYRTYAPDENVFAEAEQSAKAARRGLWEATNPQAPWEFRRQAREAGK